ncbi:autotransporter domain-containing protein [Kordiimonas sp. SCSIO 12610]|uniref:autotransporter domain-containing protein n=1 Tax=Kordiimonas sp. SCSIO 12610 TaxID=2829597 RepID=UPI00210EA088|nr:autotransporter domain-containing protein [Kordiimonas sp. SCSIO 12610]UTW54776.1 autotransporter domain-containing protein [Kordiimonas sp. SCSIO 12610]
MSKKFGKIDSAHTARFLNKRLMASTSLLAMALSGAVSAQTIIPNGDNQSRTSQVDGETILVDTGSTSTVAGAPLLTVNNNDVIVNNAGTLSTTGVTNTLTLNGNGIIINNTNTGSITADSRAIEINGLNAAIVNDGSILGTLSQRNGTVYSNVTANNFSLTNSGTIDAGAGQIGAGFSAELAAEGTDFDIINSGTIAGRGNEGAGLATAGDGIRLERTRVGGALDATTTGLFTGTITNSGTISSEGANGTVAGFRAVNGVSFQGTLTNEVGGVISGTQNGVYFGNPTPAGGGDHTGGVVNNAGTISSDSRALNIDGIGLEVNNLASGEIIGTGNQRNGTVYADGTADDFTFNNAGSVDAGEGNTGSGFGAEIGGAADGANTFDLINSGTIQGRGQASAAENAAGDGVRIGNVGNIGVFDGTITNSGEINSESTQGTTAGIRFVNGISFQGTLTNTGTISGAQNGLYFGNPVDGAGADHTGGVVNNAGTISSDSRALNIDGIGLEVNNTGLILGTGNQRNGTVYADSTAQDFTFNNAGLVDAGAGNTGSGFGAEIAADGNTFDLINSGTIQGRGQASAAENAAGDGVRIGNVGNIGVFDGTITNSGTINSESTQGTTAGIRFVNGISFQGTLTNEAGGVISGAQNGLYFGNPVDGAGADHTGGVVNNFGTISSGSRALNIDGIGLTVNNLATGEIIGTGNQRNGTVYADSTAQDFTFNNAGLVDAGAGNTGSGFGAEIAADGNTFDLINSGTIQGRGQASAAENAAGDGVRIGNVGNIGVFDGTITNSGTINSESTQGTTAGIRFVNGISFQGTLTNEAGGVISGAQNGLYFGNPVDGAGADHTGGVVNNFGTISSGSRALNIDGIGLEVNNLATGEIIGTGNQRNGTVYADSTAQDFTFNNAGLVDAGAGNTGSGFGAEIAADGNTFDLINSGTIQGRGQASAAENAAGDGVRIGNVGNIGVFDGTITNSGTINSESTQGTTAGIRFVNGISFQGTLTNEAGGVISGAQNGLYFGNPVDGAGADHTGGVVNNAGTISSDSRALNIDGIGLEVNNLATGEIIGTGNQRNGTVYADSTAQDFTFNNAGLVDAGAGNTGSGFGAEIAADGNTFDLINSGTIQGRGQASAAENAAGDGVRIGNVGNIGVFDGTITNSGTINSESTQGTTAGIRFVNGISFQGTLTNEAGGVISGAQNGLYFGNPVDGAGADHTGGVVNNFGTISSGSRALNIDGIGLTVNNSGSILGTGDQRNGTVYFDGTANNVTLNNLAGGVIDAGAGNNGSGVSIQALAGERTHTISNAGIIQGRGTALASGEAAGLRVFYPPNMMRPVVNLDIDNTGTIASETSAGILLENITFAGDITNSGTISGATAAIDASTSFGNVIINNSGDLVGGVLTGAGDDVLNISGGSISGDIDLGTGSNQVNILAGGSLDVVGTINVASDVAVDGLVNFDLGEIINVDGNATFGNASQVSLNFTDVTSLSFGQATNLITTTGTLTNNGVSFAPENNFLVDFNVVASSNAVSVTPTVVNLAALSNDVNVSSFGSAFAGALQAGNGDAAFAANANAINGFTNNRQFELAASSLLPTLNEGVTREVYETQNQVLSLIDSRLGGDAEGNAIWGQAFGRTADRDSEGGLTFSGYDADSYGFVIGADTAIADNVRAGVAFSYSDIDVEETSGAFEETSIDSYSLNAYASYEDEGTFVNGALAYVFGNADSSRQAIVDTISSDFDVDQFSAKVTAGYKANLGDLEFSPFASLQYANISQSDFTEIGGLNLVVDADSVTIFETGVGAKFALPIENDGFKLVPQVSVGWYYDLADEARSLNASFAGGNNFALTGVDPTASSFEVDASLGIFTSGNTSITLGYEGEYRSDFNSHAGVARIRFAF